MDFQMTLFFFSTFFLVGGGIIALLPGVKNIQSDFKKQILKPRVQMRLGVYGLAACAVFGFFPADGTLLLGDLLPFLVSLLLMVLFLMGYVRESSHLDENTVRKADQFLTGFQIPAGILAILAGLLHMLFPRWPVL
jgi:uncharacterized membrane protein HdeD (DUF308 family)